MESVYLEKRQCYGCGLCAQKCPTKAISIIPDDDGFYYPSIARDICIDCGLCKKVCIYNHDKFNNISKSYLAKYNNENILRESTSGGIFSLLADWVIKNNGVVYGAGFNENMKVTLQRADNELDYSKFRGSKYVQCYIPNNMYIETENDLKDGKYVLFTGTPCMISAINSYITPNLKSNLITCDLICNGVSSPLIWSVFVSELEKKHKDKLVFYKFRSKSNESNFSKDEIALFSSGKKITLFDPTDKYNNSVYYANLAMRPSCHNCKFTSEKRVGDFTIGDCLHILNDFPDFDSYLGASTLLANSEKAERILSLLSESANLCEIPINKAISLRMTKPIEENPKSAEFIRNVKNHGLKKAIILKNGKINYYKIRVYNKIKKILKIKGK